MTDGQDKHLVAVVGAGPAGLYASKQLAAEGVQVVLLNRDIKLGGLAEYGIFHNKHKMKAGLRKQFRQIMSSPDITYFGNVTVGEQADLSLDDLGDLGFQAILATVGAQGTKWLGLPGEDLTGVYHAKDIVYHYNQLPPYSQQDYFIGKKVGIIGVGNVMMDIAHWLIRDLKVDEVTAIARRGPIEVKFTKKEMQNIGKNLDLEDLDAEIERVLPVMQRIGQDTQSARDFILAGLPKAQEPVSDTVFRFRFLMSPKQILDNSSGYVGALEVDDTTLVLRDYGDTKAQRLGTTQILDVDTVIFCIGDRVDEDFGLPVEWSEFIKNSEPRFPINDVSYEAFNPELEAPIKDVFVAGWSRKASDGLVGVARKDGESGARAVYEYLQTLPAAENISENLDRLEERLWRLDEPVITKEDWQRLEAIEQEEAEKRGLPEFKFGSNEEMLAALGFMAAPVA